MLTHEKGTTLVYDAMGLAAWLTEHGLGHDVSSLIEAIERQAAGRLPVFPMQCRAAPDNLLAADARGVGNIGPGMSVFPVYGKPTDGHIDRMALEIKTDAREG